MMKKKCLKCKFENNKTHVYCCNCSYKFENIEDDKVSSFKSFIYFIWEMINKLMKGAFRNLYLIMLFISISYFVVYAILIFNIQESGPAGQESLNKYGLVFWLDFFKNIALLVFSAGIFTSSLKYLQYINIFENEFQKILLSDPFTSKIKESVESITYSDEHLLRQKDLDGIWKRVTLSKYKQRFPELMVELVKNLENELFLENNLTCYYKNFQMNLSFELLDNDIVKIIESSEYTIISNSEDDVKINIFIHSKEESGDIIYSTVIPELTKIDGTPFDSSLLNKPEEKEGSDRYTKEFEFNLSGNGIYQMERAIEMTQDLNNDRLFSFTSSKIIDDLTVDLQFCDKLNVIFSKVGNNKFNETRRTSTSYRNSNRYVLLPGEKFKAFIYKK